LKRVKEKGKKRLRSPDKTNNPNPNVVVGKGTIVPAPLSRAAIPGKDAPRTAPQDPCCID